MFTYILFAKPRNLFIFSEKDGKLIERLLNYSLKVQHTNI